jgi:predicted DsbA family dithiol-disulfide isomerase
MMAQRVVVNVVSDAICPWCFVGKRRLEKAVAALGAAAVVTVRWRPYFLDATLPPEGVDKLERYTKKFGAARVAQMLPMMEKVGAAEGIAFDYGGRISPTALAHALAELAWARGGAAQQDRLVEALFKFYFERQGDLGDAAALRGVCAGAGLAGADVEAVLARDSPLLAAVEAEADEWRERFDVSGVPLFVIQREGPDGPVGQPVVMEGAQEPEMLLAAFQRVGVKV